MVAREGFTEGGDGRWQWSSAKTGLGDGNWGLRIVPIHCNSVEVIIIEIIVRQYVPDW